MTAWDQRGGGDRLGRQPPAPSVITTTRTRSDRELVETQSQDADLGELFPESQPAWRPGRVDHPVALLRRCRSRAAGHRGWCRREASDQSSAAVPCSQSENRRGDDDADPAAAAVDGRSRLIRGAACCAHREPRTFSRARRKCPSGPPPHHESGHRSLQLAEPRSLRMDEAGFGLPFAPSPLTRSWNCGEQLVLHLRPPARRTADPPAGCRFRRLGCPPALTSVSQAFWCRPGRSRCARWRAGTSRSSSRAVLLADELVGYRGRPRTRPR